MLSLPMIDIYSFVKHFARICIDIVNWKTLNVIDHHDLKYSFIEDAHLPNLHRLITI